MKLYHFTRKSNIDSIKKNGINPGQFPFKIDNGVELVSLTSNLTPHGHGLIAGQVISEQDRVLFKEYFRLFPEHAKGDAPNRVIQLWDQTEAAVELDLSNKNKSLWSFDKFADKAAKWHYLEKDVCKANALATADFPLGDVTEDQLILRTREILSQLQRRNFQDRGWYFYTGKINPCFISNILLKQPDGSYR